MLNRVKEQLRNRFNLSLLDLSGEYPKEAEIALAFLSPDEPSAQKTETAIQQLLESRFPEYEFTLEPI